MSFDVDGARREGYSDTEIAEHLARTRGFDVQGARKEGYADAEIIAHLTRAAAAPATRPSAARAALQILSPGSPGGIMAPESTRTAAPAAPAPTARAIEPAIPADIPAARGIYPGSGRDPVGPQRPEAEPTPLRGLMGDFTSRRVEGDPQPRVAIRTRVPVGETPNTAFDPATTPGLTPPGGTAAERLRLQDIDESYRDAPMVVRGARQGIEAMRQQNVGLQIFAADMLGLDDAAAASRANYERSDRTSKAVGTPEDFWPRAVEGGIASIVANAQSIAGGAAGGALAMGRGASAVASAASTSALTTMGTLVFGDEYQRGREAGLSPTEATTRGMVMAAAEVIGERVGLKNVANSIAEAVRTVSTRELPMAIGKYMASQQVGEQVTLALQAGTDTFSPVGITPDMTLAQYLQAVADTAASTLVQTAVMGGGAQAATAAANLVRRNLPPVDAVPRTGAIDLTASTPTDPKPLKQAASLIPDAAPVSTRMPATPEALEPAVPVPATPPAGIAARPPAQPNFGLPQLGEQTTVTMPSGAQVTGAVAGVESEGEQWEVRLLADDGTRYTITHEDGARFGAPVAPPGAIDTGAPAAPAIAPAGEPVGEVAAAQPAVEPAAPVEPAVEPIQAIPTRAKPTPDDLIRQVLAQLRAGNGVSVGTVAAAAGVSREEADAAIKAAREVRKAETRQEAFDAATDEYNAAVRDFKAAKASGDKKAMEAANSRVLQAQGRRTGAALAGVKEAIAEESAKQTAAEAKVLAQMPVGARMRPSEFPEGRGLFWEKVGPDRWEKRGQFGNSSVNVLSDSQMAAAGGMLPMQAIAIEQPKASVPAVQPRLFVEWNGRRMPVESIEDAQEKWTAFREQSGAGASEIGEAAIIDQDGKPVATIAYNGNVRRAGEKRAIDTEKPAEKAARVDAYAKELEALDASEGGRWWDSLTDAERRTRLDGIGSKLVSGVAWRNVPEGTRTALEKDGLVKAIEAEKQKLFQARRDLEKVSGGVTAASKEKAAEIRAKISDIERTIRSLRAKAFPAPEQPKAEAPQAPAPAPTPAPDAPATSDRPDWFRALPRAGGSRQAGRVAFLKGKKAAPPKSYTDPAAAAEWLAGWNEASAAQPAVAQAPKSGGFGAPLGKFTFDMPAGKIEVVVTQNIAPEAYRSIYKEEGGIIAFALRGAVDTETGSRSVAGVTYKGALTPERIEGMARELAEKHAAAPGKPSKSRDNGKPAPAPRGGMAGEDTPAARAALEALRDSGGPTTPSNDIKPPAWREVGKGFSAREYVIEYPDGRLEPRQEVRSPNGSIITRGLQPDGKPFAEMEGEGTLADVLKGTPFKEFEQFFQKQEALPSKRKPAEVIDNGATNPGEFIVRDAGTNLARFFINDNGRAVKIKYFFESQQTRDHALEAINAFVAKRAAAPKPDKAEIRPYRRSDGSIGYEAVPIQPPAAVDEKIAEPDWWKNSTGAERVFKMKAAGFDNHTGSTPWNRLPAAEQRALDRQWGSPAAEQPAAPAGGANTIFTEDAAAAARERLRKKLGRLNAGIDPEMMQDGITLAGYHVERGARTFAAFARAMIADLGEAVRPYLKSWYMGVKYDPRAAGLDGLSSAAEVEAADVNAIGGEDAGSMDAPGGSALEDAPADPVSGTAPSGAAEQGTAGSGRADGQGDGRASGERVGPRAGVGDGAPAVPVPAGGSGSEGAGRSGDRQPGVRGDAGNQPPVEDAGARLAASDTPAGQPEQPAPRNHTIAEDDGVGEGGAVAKFKGNVAAIELLRTLEAENRPASADEAKILARYVGWGGLKQAFRPKSGRAIAKGWEARVEELERLLTPQEYEAANRSILDAHYTSVPVVQSMWDIARHLGFRGGRVQETSMGTGNFFGLMPGDLRTNSALTGVELDSLTARIAAKLYPQANVLNMGYQDARFPDEWFDLTVGNPPFGDQAIPYGDSKHLQGFSIHNFMFAKAIDKLAPGGLHIQVVSHNFLDARKSDAREYIAHRARLVGAIRLPKTAFEANAGTEVVTDIVILQKLPQDQWGNARWAQSWVPTGERTMDTDEGPKAFSVNQYFLDNPQMVMGRETTGGTMYGPNEYTVEPTGDLAEQIRAAMGYLPEGIFTREITPERINESMADALGRAQRDTGSLVAEGDKLYRTIVAGDGSVSQQEITAETPWSEKQAWGEKRVARAVGMARLRDITRRLLSAEAANEPDAELAAMRAQLNATYDAFVADHGFVNDRQNEQVFRDDPDAPLVFALEADYDAGVTATRAKSLGISARKASAKKMPIFDRRVIEPYTPPTSADSAQDALSISLSEKGVVDPAYMASLTGRAADDVLRELTAGEKPVLYQNPETGGYEPADQYLSGNVKAKYQAAMKAGLMANAEALRAVFPPDLAAGDIRARLGAPWVATSDYVDFIRHLIGDEARANINYVRATGGFLLRVTGGNPTKLTAQWGTPRRDAADLVDRLMNGKDFAVYDTQQDGSRVLNKEATDAAIEKAGDIAREFEDWLFSDMDRRERLVKHYNDHYNTNVEPKYDGSMLKLPGKVPDAIIKLRRHQMNAVWRIIRDGKALLDHVVGAGKTFTIIAGAMEVRRMGLAKKPMIAVPNHLVEQWAADVYRLYPGAKVLAMGKKDFEKSNRKRMLAKIATGDWDIVITAHSSFGFIKSDPAVEQAFYEEQIAELQEAIDTARRTAGKKDRSERDFQKKKEALEAKFKALMDKPKDDLLTFQELGVDMLFVDEAHEFKNLFFATQRRNVGGFGNPDGSKKAADLFMKTRWLQRAKQGRGVVFATGTPVSNSLTELYTVQRYLGLPELESLGLRSLDAWLNSFGSIYSDYELDGTGIKYKRKERLRALTNVPEVMAMYRQFADPVTLEDIQRNYREDNDGAEFPVPRVKGGKRQNVVVPRSQAQADYFAWIVDRATNLKRGGTDNMLAITGDARKAALDMRLVAPGSDDHPGSKTHRAADEITRIYEASRDRRGTQLVFLDLSVPLSKADGAIKAGVKAGLKLLSMDMPADWRDLDAAAQWERLRPQLVERMDADEAGQADDGESLADRIATFLDTDAQEVDASVSALSMRFSVYDDLRQKLIDRGVNPKEIAFIHDFDTDTKKQDLFDAVNAGAIRIVLGSTAKMGAGTNVQRKLVGLHHLDTPWRPSDIEQREGRIIRQGNEFRQADPEFEVEILAYATEQTYDARMWQVQEQKLIAINSLRKFSGERELEDVSSDAATAAEMKAAASGNPLILEDVQLTERIRKLEGLERRHRSSQQDLQSTVRRYERAIETYPDLIERLRADAATVAAYQADPFAGDPPEATVDGRVFNSRQSAETYVTEKIEAARAAVGEGKRAAWSITVDGKEATSMDALNDLLNAALGDMSPFAMTIGGKRYIRRQDAQRAFIDIMQPAVERNDFAEKQIGEFAGLRLVAQVQEGSFGKSLVIGITGQNTASVQFSVRNRDPLDIQIGTSFLSTAARRLLVENANQLGWHEKDLATARADLDNARGQIGQPFRYAGEIVEKRERLKEVKRLLSDTEKKPEDGATLASIDDPGAVRTDTPEFRRFFRKSKILDNDGRPLVVYHGTNRDFAEFKLGRWPGTLNDIGFWFSNEPSDAGAFARAEGGNIMPVYLRMEKPFYIDSLDDLQRLWKEHAGSDTLRKGAESFRAWLRASGYDGVVFEGSDLDPSFARGVYMVVLDPTQIKSAIGNSGAYDPENPDIRASIDEPAPWYYSALSEAVSGARLTSAPAAQWIAWLDANASKAGVKADEIEWSGVREWLNLQEGKVTKDALMEYLDANGVQVVETVYQGDREDLRRDDELLVEMTALGYEPDFEPGDGSINSIRRLSDGTEYEYEGIVDGLDVTLYGERGQVPLRVLQIANELNSLAYNRSEGVDAGNNTRWKKYTLPADERFSGYREMLLRTPGRNEGSADALGGKPKRLRPAEAAEELGVDEEQFGLEDPIGAAVLVYPAGGYIVETNTGSFVVQLPTSEERFGELDQAEAFLAGNVPDLRDRTKAYWSSHWNMANVIAHTRVDFYTAPNGKRRMRVHEIQSDWGQNERKKPGSTPPGPFIGKTDAWVGLTLKRLLALAAQEGVDEVVIINGKQAANLYGLSAVYSRLMYFQEDDGTFSIYGKEKGEIGERLVKAGVKPKDLPNLVGKDMAEKMIAGYSTRSEGDWSRRKVIDGLDLEVGGRGMRKFYDEIVPQVARDVLKRLGGTVRRAAADGMTDEVQVVIEITPDMREKVAQGMPLFSPKQMPDDLLDRLFKIAVQGYDDRSPVMVEARLRRILKEAEKNDGRIDAEAVGNLLDDVVARNDERALKSAMTERARGPLWVRERLLREMRTGTNARGAELALWMLEKNPAMATGLAVSFRGKGETAGTYSESQQLATIIAGSSDGTVVHEILHHTERMMPDDIQAGIRAEWARQLRRQLDFAIANNLEPLIRAATLALSGRTEDASTLIEAIRAREIPFEFYQYVNPSEFWAVNGTRIMMERERMAGWVQRARQWFREFIAKVKEIFGLSSDAAVIRGLEAVLRSDGAYLQKNGLAMGMADALRQPGFHGTPKRGIKQFSTTYMSTGEGGQGFGWGLYFSSMREIAEWYRRNLTNEIEDPDAVADQIRDEVEDQTGGWELSELSEDGSYSLYKPKGGTEVSNDNIPKRVRKIVDRLLEPHINKGQVYKVEIPDDDVLFQWDKPLSEQPQSIRDAFYSVQGRWVNDNSMRRFIEGPKAWMTGREAYQTLSSILGGDMQASLSLLASGVKGIKYLDGMSRSAGEGNYNYVIFDGADVEIRDELYAIDPLADDQLPSQNLKNLEKWAGSKAIGPASEMVRVYRAVPKGSAQTAIQPGDWVSASREYLVDYAGRDATVIEATIPASELVDTQTGAVARDTLIWTPSNRFGAFGAATRDWPAPLRDRVREEGTTLQQALVEGMFPDSDFLTDQAVERVIATFSSTREMEEAGATDDFIARFEEASFEDEIRTALRAVPYTPSGAAPQELNAAAFSRDARFRKGTGAPGDYTGKSAADRLAREIERKRGDLYSIDPLAGEMGNADGRAPDQTAAVNQGRDGLAEPPDAPPMEWAGPLFKDMSAFSKYAVHPRTIAAFDRAFAPVYRVAEQQMQDRDRIASELATKADPYFQLPQASKDRVNAALELGRLKGEVLAGKKMSFTNEGEPAQLSSAGEVIELSDAEKSGYWAVRGMLNDALDLFRDQTLIDFGIDPQQYQGRGVAKQLAADADQNDIAGGDPKKSERLRLAAEIVEEIEQARRTGYVPFSRYGDVVVLVRNAAGDTLWASKIDTGGAVGTLRKLGAKTVAQIPAVRAEMDRLRKEYGADVEIGAFQAKELASPTSELRMADIDMLAEVAQVDNQQWSDIREQLAAAVKAKGFRKHFFGSRNTPGYTTDFERSIADYMLGMAGYLARRKAMPKWDRTIGKIPAQKQRLLAYAKSYRDYVQSPTEEWHRLRQFGFFYYLAAVPATAMVNLTQVDLLTAPYLMQFANPVTVEAAIAKARLEAGAMMTTRAGMDVFDPAKAPADVREDLQAAWDEGFFVPLNTYELMGTAYTGSRGQRSVDRAARSLVDALALFFTTAERHNRIATFIAAHRLARADGMRDRVKKVMTGNALARLELRKWTPQGFAEWVIDETHFRMGKVNRATITRGIGAPILQFKGFVMQSLERWVTMARLQGPEGRRAMVISLGAFVLLSGFWGLPGLDDLRDLFEKLYKLITGEDFDAETRLRELVVTLTGSPMIAQMFAKGVTYPAGLDLSGRIGMGNIAPDTPLQMLGIPADLFIARPQKAIEKASQDNWMGALAEMSPNFLKNPLMGASWAQDGIYTGRGARLLTPEQLDRTDIAMRMLGFQPSKVTNEREIQFATRRASTAVDEKRRDFYTRLSQALADEQRAYDRGDAEAAKAAFKRARDVQDEVIEHNRTAPDEAQIILNNATLRRRINEDLNGRKGTGIRRQARGRAEEIREIYGETR